MATQNNTQTGQGKIVILSLGAHKILMANEDGGDLKTVRDELDANVDGVGIDVANKHIYFTNMGVDPKKNDGSVMRMDLDGGNLKYIVPVGGTFTGKQLTLDLKNRKIYWCDREGMRVMRVNMDGTNLETLVQTGFTDADRLDARNWCVGIALDLEKNQMYWTQKGSPKGNVGRLFRAGLELPPGEGPAERTDIELLFDGLPEPIDLLINHKTRELFWTDRGAPPRGNTLNRVDMNKLVKVDKKAPASKDHIQPDILEGGFKEAIGVAADWENKKFFVTDLSGTVYSSDLDGSNKKAILNGLNYLTGIEFARI